MKHYLLVLGLLLAACDSQTTAEIKHSGTLEAEKAAYAAEYNRLHVGMTRSEVIQTLKNPGARTDSVNHGKFYTTTYKWEYQNGMSISILFRGNIVMDKQEEGLGVDRPQMPLTEEMTEPSQPASGLTFANYQRLEAGISYDEAVTILGSNGQETSSSNIGGTRTIMYQWVGEGGANMNAIFQNDKLVSKAQLNLP